MERVVQAGPGRERRFADWPVIAGVLLVLSIGMVLDGGQLLGWTLGGLPQHLLALIAALALLLLPGLALLRLLWMEDLPPDEHWPLAVGVSCALLPLLLLAGDLPGLRWSGRSAWVMLALCGAVVAWPRRGTARVWPGRELLARHHLLLVAITLGAVAVRLYAARDLPAGMWGDSYHHTVIAQLLVDHGGLFSSWQPYAPLTTFTYHFGFHSTVAWFTWLTGMPVVRSLLVVGQVQSALAAPLVYLLTVRLLGSRAAGLWAALLVGLVLPLPAYYLNWGRYTQLAGQTVLPALCVAWMALLDRAPGQPPQRGLLLRPGLLVALLTAGLALTHYRVAVFAACFVVSYALYLLAARVRSLRALVWLAGTGLAAGALALLLIGPWLVRLREGQLLLIGQKFATSNIGAAETNSLPVLDELLTLHAPLYLLLPAGLGLVLLLWRRQWRGLVLLLWAGLVWLAANPYLMGLPGAGILTSYAVLIAGYLVLAPLAGAAPALLFARLPRSAPVVRWMPALSVCAGACVALWGMGQQQHLARPDQFQLLTAADAAAMDWIRHETPDDAGFFVNSFRAYQGTLYAGSDGGWWLPFLSGRRSNLPPITYGSEAGLWPYYQIAVNRATAAVQRHPLDSPEAVAALRAEGFGYLYDGPAALPPGEYIDPALLAQSSFYELIYRRDGVTIWRVR